jgi:hypothetical protein
MKHLLSIALILTAAAIPASAQRGGSRGGFSGRGSASAPAFHGGSSFSSPSHFSGISRAPMARPAFNARPSFYSANRYPGNFPGNRYPGGNRYPVRRGFPSRGIGYGYPGGTSYVPYPFLDTSFDDYADYDDSGYNEAPIPYAEPAPDPAAYGYIQPEEQSQTYGPEPQQAAEITRPATYPRARPEPAPAPATTLIFKDGRAPERIGNYIATRSTVTVIDGPRHHDIPVADLDLAATVKANRDSGAGFQLPAAP